MMLPLNFAPMLATTAQPFDSPDFIYEIKWDGYRCLAFLDSQTRLQSRNLKDISFLFPELTNLHQKVSRSGCLMDGEVIALRNQKPSFLELQKRAQLRDTSLIETAARTIPVFFVLFDLLYYQYEPIFNRPWQERRQLLEECLQEDERYLLSGFIQEKGVAYFEAISQLKLEGVLAKQKNGIYCPGKRVHSWCKFKKRILANFIICGYTTATNILSSLILGSFWEGRLRYMGIVGTGFTHNELGGIAAELQKIAVPDSPFRDQIIKIPYSKQPKKTIWTKPIVVCEVEYLELTDEGILRHPSLKRFRPDLKPEDCEYGETS